MMRFTGVQTFALGAMSGMFVCAVSEGDTTRAAVVGVTTIVLTARLWYKDRKRQRQPIDALVG